MGVMNIGILKIELAIVFSFSIATIQEREAIKIQRLIMIPYI